MFRSLCVSQNVREFQVAECIVFTLRAAADTCLEGRGREGVWVWVGSYLSHSKPPN